MHLKLYASTAVGGALVGLVVGHLVLGGATPAEQEQAYWTPYAAALLMAVASALGMALSIEGHILLPGLLLRLQHGPFFWRMIFGIALAAFGPSMWEVISLEPLSGTALTWARLCQVTLIILSVLNFVLRRRITQLRHQAGDQDKPF